MQLNLLYSSPYCFICSCHH